jgi:hypothetical protein
LPALEDEPYPRYRKAVIQASLAGLWCAALAFLVCYWMAGQPAVTPVSVCYSFRPWWRASNWLFAALAFAFVFAIAFVHVAYRPVGLPFRNGPARRRARGKPAA